MQVHIYRRAGESPNWHAQVYVGGKRYRFSCDTEEKATAREYARQRVEELKAHHNRGLVGLPEPVRMSQVFDRYEHESLPKLRPASQRRTAGILSQARTWFCNGALATPRLLLCVPTRSRRFLRRSARMASALARPTSTAPRSTASSICVCAPGC